MGLRRVLYFVSRLCGTFSSMSGMVLKLNRLINNFSINGDQPFKLKNTVITFTCEVSF